MKKLLALVLALVMVLGLGVSAFAATLDVITLAKEKKDAVKPNVISTLDKELKYAADGKINETVYRVLGGDDYYLAFPGYDNYKNITVTANGGIDAKIVDFDADTMRYPEDEEYYEEDGDEYVKYLRYFVVDSLGATANASPKAKIPYLKNGLNDYTSDVAGFMTPGKVKAAINELYKTSTTTDVYTIGSADVDKFETVVADKTFKDEHDSTFANDKDSWIDWYGVADYYAGLLNDKAKADRFSVGAFVATIKTETEPWKYPGEYLPGWDLVFDNTWKWTRDTKTYAEEETKLLQITVPDNYSASFKEGTVKINATRKSDKKAVTATFTVISDVVIFEYEEVKYAVNGALDINADLGYSDYETYKLGYDKEHEKYDVKEYDYDELREYPKPTVVSTTEFRAIEGEELEVDVLNGDQVKVTIEEIAKGQKGVNFAFKGFQYYDEDGDKLKHGDETGYGNEKVDKYNGFVNKIDFGFLGDQVINSDFVIDVDMDMDWFQLRDLFGKKIEEEDIITYYVLKDGVKYDEVTVDYKDDDVDDNVVFEILGKAGDKLGYYTITLDAPAEEEGEENPNTGAESVVGVVAAMAVISLATAAAVSLKK